MLGLTLLLILGVSSCKLDWPHPIRVHFLYSIEFDEIKPIKAACNAAAKRLKDIVYVKNSPYIHPGAFVPCRCLLERGIKRFRFGLYGIQYSCDNKTRKKE